MRFFLRDSSSISVSFVEPPIGRSCIKNANTWSSRNWDDVVQRDIVRKNPSSFNMALPFQKSLSSIQTWNSYAFKIRRHFLRHL